MDILIKSMTESMKEMMNLMKKAALERGPASQNSDERKNNQMKNKRNTMMHLYENKHPSKPKNDESPTLPTGSWLKAPDGVHGS